MRAIPGFPGYFASDTGEVFSFRSGSARKLASRVRRDGYEQVNVKTMDGRGATVAVHRLVLLAFHGAPLSDGLEARHLNGVKLDNRAENLRWGTAKDNYKDKLRHGTTGWGEDHTAAKLTDREIAEIRQRAAAGEKHTAIAKQVGVSQSHVTAIVRLRTRTIVGRGIEISGDAPQQDRSSGTISFCTGWENPVRVGPPPGARERG